MPTPGSAPVPSQGSTVTFDGQPLGSLLSIRYRSGTAGKYDITSVDSPLLGDGDNCRILRQSTVTSIDPGSVSVSLLGAPPYSEDDIGKAGSLSISTPGHQLSGEAFLESYEIDAQVGDLLKGTATFQFTGE